MILSQKNPSSRELLENLEGGWKTEGRGYLLRHSESPTPTKIDPEIAASIRAFNKGKDRGEQGFASDFSSTAISD